MTSLLAATIYIQCVTVQDWVWSAVVYITVGYCSGQGVTLFERYLIKLGNKCLTWNGYETTVKYFHVKSSENFELPAHTHTCIHVDLSSPINAVLVQVC